MWCFRKYFKTDFDDYFVYLLFADDPRHFYVFFKDLASVDYFYNYLDMCGSFSVDLSSYNFIAI